MLMRNAMIVGAMAAALYGGASLGSNTTGLILVDAGQAGLAAKLPLWVLAMIVAAAVYALCREVSAHAGPAGDAWSGSAKTLLVTGVGILACAAYAMT